MNQKLPPEGWRWVELREVATIGSGDPAPQERKYFDGGIYPFVRTQDVGRVHVHPALVETTDAVNDLAVEELRLTQWPAKSLIIPKSGASTFLNHRVLTAVPAYVASHLAVIVSKRHVLAEYLYFWSLTMDSRQIAPENNYPSLRLSDLEKLKLPLPPLPVQERIVQILQKADEIRRKRKEALELADKILPALFLEMFGDPATNPKGWPKLPLGKCTAIRRGLSKRPSPTGNVPIVRIKNLTLWGLDLSWSERVQASPQEIERGRLLPGDIVFSPLNGSISHLAKSDVFTVPETEIWVLDSNLCAFRVNESVVRNRFLAAFLALPSTLELFRRRLAVKTSGGQWLLKTSTLQGVEVPVPPLQLQDYFIQQVERHLDVRKKCTDALKESELCFASLLSQSFTGELTAEWEAANAEWIAERQAFYERLPRLVILALLAEKAKRAGRAAATVLITALMKYVFLFQMEGNGGRRRLYHFVPYHYGPFSKEVYADLEALEQEGLVRVEKDPEEEKTKITLADAPKIEERLAMLPDDIKQDVAVIIETYGDLDHATLLSTVYEKYPAYARESQLKRRGHRGQ
jgi:type I restriction enzyme S subunit